MLLSGPSRPSVIIWAKLFLAYKNSGFKRFLAHTVIILCFFCAQLSGNFLKIAFFKKRVQKLGFSNFSVLSSFLKWSFLGLLKHYKNRGFSRFLCFFVVEREEKRQKNDNWNFWICFCPKMAVSWRITVFPKMPCWNPYFYSVFGCALSGPSCQKGNFWTPPKKKKFWLIIEKLFLFLVFLCFFFFFFFLSFSFLLFFWATLLVFLVLLFFVVFWRV